MPHISNYRLNGKYIPSVSACVESLGGRRLIDNFYRRHGFEKADQISREARVKGSGVAAEMETFRKTRDLPLETFAEKCARQWFDWYMKSPYTILRDEDVECHLVNIEEEYHGSPDMVMRLAANNSKAVLGDDKVKKRLADYGLLMAEHGYAACTHIDIGGKLVPVPWELPLDPIWFFTYEPVTARMYPQEHKFDLAVYEDFLTCRSMVDVNDKAERYFDSHAITLDRVFKNETKAS